MTIPTKLWLYLCAIILWSGAWWCGGYHTRDLSATAEAQALELKRKNESLRLSERLRIKEQYYQHLISVLDSQYQEKLENERKKSDGIIADIESNGVRIKPRFKCPVPSTSGSTSGSDDEADAGLQNQEAKVLIRESARADEIVLQLQACQGYIEAIHSRQ